MGNTFRSLLNDAAHSPEDWAEFRNTVEDARLARTGAWVRFWDKQMTAQTSWRADVPPHYSTGALDPKIADVRQMLERRRWTFRNLTRMNHLLSLIRLHINQQDDPAVWAQAIASTLPEESRTNPEGEDGQLDFRRFRTNVPKQADPVTELEDGSRVYTLRKHPVPPREI
jgi:hypothetical protein